MVVCPQQWAFVSSAEAVGAITLRFYRTHLGPQAFAAGKALVIYVVSDLKG